jgi:hypothetical protein
MEAREKDTRLRVKVTDFENREYPRLDIHLPIEYDQINSSIANTGNISMGGLLIFLPKETVVSQHLRLKLFFSLGSELNTIKVLTEVVWMDNHFSEDLEGYPHGLKFIEISPEDRTKLRNLLNYLSFPLEYESQTLMPIKHKSFPILWALKTSSLSLSNGFSSFTKLFKPRRKDLI